MDSYQYASNEHESFSLRWIQGAKPEFAGIQGMQPYVLSGTGMCPSAHIDLYAARSRSFPYYSKKGTWEGLIPTWKFRDANGNQIDYIDVSGTSGENGVYTYSASAWYVDDLCTEKRTSVYLWATMDMSANTVSGEYGNPSYANSKVFDVCEAKVGRLYPDEIRLTTNGYIPLSSNYHWTNHVVPAIATVHSKYYDIIADDKISVYPGVIYDFPGNASANVPLYCTPITSRTTAAQYVGLSSDNGKIVYDEEGLPVSATTTNYYYTRTPVTYNDRYNHPYAISSLFINSSADGDIEKDPFVREIKYKDSSAYFKCPVFAQYDLSDDKYFIGGYTICDITMPDKSLSAGEVFTAKIPIDESSDAYLPPYSTWISDPNEGRLFIVPFKTFRTEDDSIESPYGNIPIIQVASSDIHLTSSMEQYADAIRTSAYYVENVHGIYCMAKDFEYNIWTIDVENARLVKYNAYGAKAGVDIDLNESFWNWVNSSACDAEHRELAYEYYGKEDEPSEFDIANKSLQPSYIVISPEQSVLLGERPGIYVSYHNSYLITTHDLSGNVVDADFSNPSGLKGYTYEFDRNRRWSEENMRFTYLDSSEKMAEVDADQTAMKMFHAEVDNVNKPGIMALWGDNDIWVTYSSTSRGINPVTFDDISDETESKLVVYDRRIGIHHDVWESIKYTWDLEFGESFEDLCIYNGVAYALVINNKHQAKFMSFSISKGAIQEAEAPTTILDYGTIEDPGNLSITEDGVAWFSSRGNQIIGYDINTKECYCFSNLYKQEYWLDMPEDALSGSMAIRKENPLSGRYTEHEFQKIDAMSVDTDDYLWIVDNLAHSPVQVFDTNELMDMARRRVNGDPRLINEVSYSEGTFFDKTRKRQVFPKGRYITIDGTPENRYEWTNERTQDRRMDAPQFYNSGDWTGIKYEILINQCYKPKYAELNSGRNYVMNYDRLRFRRFNESRDIIPDMKSCIRTSKFAKSSETFWDEFINSMIGGVDNKKYHIGRRLYERIGNIVPNLHDIEDSTITGIYDMSKMQDSPISIYDISPPETLARLFDILSCSHERIWGDRCHCKNNFVEINKNTEQKVFFCNNCQHWHRSNLGFKFDIYGRNLLLDRRPYVVRNPMDSKSKYVKIQPSVESVKDALRVLKRMNTSDNGWNFEDYANECIGKIDNKPTDTYPLTDDFIEGIRRLDTPKNSRIENHIAKILAIHTQFFIREAWYEQCFWDFRDYECNVQNIGIVRWDDEYTTFPERLKSIDSFYKSPDPAIQNKYGLPEGYLELIINFLLHNGLLCHKDKEFAEN